MLLSIVTVNYNDLLGLEKTIKSVQNQTFGNIEFIVVDGGSNDGSKELILNNTELITKNKIEKDKGIYDAMNKGIEMSTGDFLIFMNSGDNFANNNVLENFSKNITDINKTYFGVANIINSNGAKWNYPNKTVTSSNVNNWLKNNLPNHQAMFFPKNYYQKYKYDLRFSISGDSDYKFKSKKECGFVFLDFEVCDFYVGGVSSNFGSFKKVKTIIKESWIIHSKYRGNYKAIKRIFNIIIKYIINSIFGDNGLSFMIKTIRK